MGKPRKSKENRKLGVSMTMTRDQLDALDALADALGRTRGETVAWLLEETAHPDTAPQGCKCRGGGAPVHPEQPGFEDETL
jgi:hypothetical protein